MKQITTTELVQLIADKQHINTEIARYRIKETRDEIMANPDDADDILKQYLGLDSSYLTVVCNF